MSPKSHLGPAEHTLYLVDVSSLIYRAFYAVRPLQTHKGEPTNAVYGVATMLSKLAEEAHPQYLAVVYDSKEPTFRTELYSEYKANRSEAPESLIPQFDWIEELIRAFEIHSYRLSGIEADDLIATLTDKWSQASPKNRVVIVSNDKDLMQLVNDRVTIWDTMGNKFYTPKEVEEKFGVKPDQIRDYLALVGDSSDNIPGVPSIGPKSASELLKAHSTLKTILSAAKKGKISGKKGEVLQLHEKDALLSAELATVKRDLDVEIPLDSLKYHFRITKACADLLKRLEFHSLLKRWEAFAEPTEPEIRLGARETPVEVDDRFRTITTQKELQSLLEGMEGAGEFGFDIETTSLNPRNAEIVGFSVCYDPEFACYIPLGHRGDASARQLERKSVYQQIGPLLEESRLKKIGQNLKFDWSILKENGFDPKGLGADTMIASYLLDPESKHSLESLAAQYLNYRVMTYEEVCGKKGKGQLCFDQIPIPLATRYSAEDAWVAVQLWKKLEPILKSEELMPIFERLELPLVEVLTQMELQGVCVDVPWLKKLSAEFEEQLIAIEQKMKAYVKGPLNLNSPKQLAQLLFEELKLPTQSKTKTGYSTDAKVLEALAPLHEVPRLLLEYREISKLKGTYVDPLPGLRDSKTGKIHPSFNQTITATGRLSCSDPNLQNIPIRTDRGMKIRGAFVPSEGNVLLSADYSQIELRLLAHMSRDPELVRSFQKDEDIHRRTASELFHVPTDQVSDRQRGIAKAINFGLMYGKTAFGLAQELKISRHEAQTIITRYFERYRAVKDFLDRQIADARSRGFVCTLMGRKRRLPDIHSKNPMVRNLSERMAMNTPIQGTAADLMKQAMLDIEKAIQKGGYQARLVIQVHDEVLLDCPRSEINEVRALVEKAMVSAMSLEVPLKVNSAVGKSWMEL